MGVERITGFIAFCDNDGCLSSVEDRNAKSASALHRALVTTATDAWCVEDGKLICDVCREAVENAKLLAQEEEEYRNSPEVLNAKSMYANWLRDQGYAGYVKYILSKFEIIQHDAHSPIPLQFKLNGVKLDKGEAGFRGKHAHVLHQLWLEQNEKGGK